MPDTKITALTAITTVNPATSPLVIVDLTDTSMAASGTTKKATVNQLLGSGGTATLASATITGDLTVDTSTLKVDSTNNYVGIGTAAPIAQLISVLNATGIAGRLNTNTIGSAISASYQVSGVTSGTLPFGIRCTGNAFTGISGQLYASQIVAESTSALALEMFTTGNTPICFGVNGAETMRLNATGLGIGASPNSKLHLDGTCYINSALTLPALSTSLVTGEIHAGAGNAVASDSGFLRLSAGGGSTLGVKTALDIYRESGTGAAGLIAYVGGATAMTLNATGLGIGASPTNKLNLATSSGSCIAGMTNGTNSCQYAIDSTGPYIYSVTSGAQSLRVLAPTGSTVFTIDGTGNVGIGVTSSAWLSSYKSIDILAQAAFFASNTAAFVGSNLYVASGGVVTYKTANNASYFAANNSGVFSWYRSNNTPVANGAATFTESMQVDANGNLILQSSSTPATLTTNGQLTVNATSNTNLRFSYRGSDGVTRVANITLA